MVKVSRKWTRAALMVGGAEQWLWPWGKDNWGHRRASLPGLVLLPPGRCWDTRSRRSSRHESSGEAGLISLTPSSFFQGRVSFLREKEAVVQPMGERKCKCSVPGQLSSGANQIQHQPHGT